MKGRIGVLIIKSVSDIRKLKDEGSISEQLTKHIEEKVVKLWDILGPSLGTEVFSLEDCLKTSISLLLIKMCLR